MALIKNRENDAQRNYSFWDDLINKNFSSARSFYILKFYFKLGLLKLDICFFAHYYVLHLLEITENLIIISGKICKTKFKTLRDHTNLTIIKQQTC